MNLRIASRSNQENAEARKGINIGPPTISRPHHNTESNP
jgi:hypothetical protein